ncbi:MAG: hypothetical protein DI556_09760 [Rhodovulum sulfidophilum]|uniref:DUF2184 domain-containing protein n=1 Tax=Rhodovulum sulfidophilum TaxID=35806 RepID=A0A2W5PXX5_RHOSU|nr:MAG: hypothetical protein DI556_09760 [Rhodovulum sulfidophilum]
MHGYNTDSMQQALAFLTAQAYKVNATVYATVYPDWDFGRLIYVDSSGPAWVPGTITYMTDFSGKAEWQSTGAKDIPLADVSGDFKMSTFHMAAIGYQYNLGELQQMIGMGLPLPTRRASAARQAYTKFMFDLTLFGDTTKGLYGVCNNPNVPVIALPADGTGGVRFWVDENGVGMKEPAKIVRDVNLMIQGVAQSTFDTVYADTVLLPKEALDYISGTPYSALTTETILSFILRTNLYTIRTGRQLTIRSFPELSTAATSTAAPSSAGLGRMVAYNNAPEYMKLNLPMPHQFLPVWQDGPMNWLVPGIFRTGGVEFMSTVAVRYADGVSEPAAVV